MNDSQQALSRRIASVVKDVAHRIEHLQAENESADHSWYLEARVRLHEMKREVDDLFDSLRDDVETWPPAFRANADRYLEDMQERLVALQTQLNSYHWQYGAR